MEVGMKKLLFLLLVVFVVSGCDIMQNASMNNQPKDEVLVEEMLSSLEGIAVVVEEEITAVVEEEKIEAVSEELEVEALVIAKKEEAPIIESNQEIIRQNRWGFSIYDPNTGVTEYYASKGSYLGKESIQQ